MSELAGLYDQLPERGLKEQVLLGLGQRDEPEAVDRLPEIARGGDPEPRKKAPVADPAPRPAAMA